MAFPVSLISEVRIYEPAEIDDMISEAVQVPDLVQSRTKTQYYNIPAAFDIEVTSFIDNGDKRAIMYEWTFGLNGRVMIGRTWDEWTTVLNRVQEVLGTYKDLRLIIYVHNLSYEFQFMRKHFEWIKVFAVDSLKPVYAVTTTGIEFRCSYLLSGYSLAKLSDQLTKYHVEKKVGDLDYSLLRHSGTELTPEEIGYCVNDVLVVMAYIQEKIIQDKGIHRIPITKTGYVRNFCRNSCFYEPGVKNSFKRLNYSEFIHGLTLEPDEYKQLKRAFQGGFTHANPFTVGKVLNDISSDDFNSSYPAVLVAEKFPMSKGEVIELHSKEEFNRNLRLYCCLFDVEIFGLEPLIFSENYLSVSRCWDISCPITNNGRIVYADHLFTTITEQDYMILKRFYRWDDLRVYNFRRYRKGYLPTDFVKSILKLYNDKTQLKGVQGKEVEYLKSKENLNSCYGMAVTDIVRDEYKYKGDTWLEPSSPDLQKAIEKYNRNPGRFLFYPWGVWVTAYARANLFTGILSFGDDYVYSDTDSIKAQNREKHQAYIDKYNAMTKRKMYAACDYHGLPHDIVEPKTKSGKIKLLGVWDAEEPYKQFKTLGAKRYMTETEDGISITVSGLNKKTAVPFMQKKWGKDIWEHFNDGLYIPPQDTGKNTHTYIHDRKDGILIDYRGVPGEYHELSAVHMEGAEYSLSLSDEYIKYIAGVQEREV